MDSSESEDYETGETGGSESEEPRNGAGSAEPKAARSPEAEERDRLAKENADLRDKLLRTLAELENTRRRSAEEKDRALKFAVAGFVKDLIVIMEDFHLALASVGEGEKDESFKVFYSGIKLTFSELKKIFEKNNVKRIYPLNEQFNPNFHEAVTGAEGGDCAPGTVLEVMQAGYMLNDRVIKPALVVVAK